MNKRRSHYKYERLAIVQKIFAKMSYEVYQWPKEQANNVIVQICLLLNHR